MTYKTKTTGFNPIAIRTHKASKNHTCVCCNRTIVKGTKYVKTVCTEDGLFMSHSWLKSCHDNHTGYCEDRAKEQ